MQGWPPSPLRHVRKGNRGRPAAKIGAAKRGIPTPDHVKEAIARAKTGSKATQQTRLKMSEAGEENPTLDKRAVMS